MDDLLLSEYLIKKARLSKYLEEKNSDGVFLTRRSNYSWLTCGARNKIADCTDNGSASLLFCKDKLYLFTTNIEMQRMIDEEINNFSFIEYVEYKWFKPEDLKKKVTGIVDLNKIRQDAVILDDVKLMDNDFNKIKYCLTDGEKSRYIELGKMSTKCMTQTCNEIKKGMSEFKVQAILSDYLISSGITPWIILAASDERLFKYRHPVPTDKKIKNYAMVVVGALKWGLITAITRLVYFGKLTEEILNARNIITGIDSEMILSSRPGIKYSDVFINEIKKFKEYGLGNEWVNHHQGGSIGYEGRYFLAAQQSKEVIEENHAIAWNPSMRGFKSEDTFIVRKEGNLIITEDENWPKIEIETKYGKISRPDILIK
ncbi:MAG: M24 family metallopeptidase [Actinobacteria bacterium]|nr:M24 family metallopeptidase [Actinomycetota bacterium]MCL6088456.1 M24 family metallopeptidase [Actinomycetota bacterium]